jgi:hypothetical protein
VQGSIYYIKNRLLIPTLARTEDGFFIEIEPVEVLEKPTHEDLVSALQRVERRGNPYIPTPPRDSFPPPIVRKLSGTRSQREFERAARHWVLESTAAGTLLIPTTRGSAGGFLHRRDEAQEFAGASALTLVAGRVLQEI